MEPLLTEEEHRLHLLPIRYPGVWELYKRHVSMFWTVGEVDLSKDVAHWEERLTPGERHFVSMVLAFFATSDGIVCDNLAERFGREVRVREVKCFYDVQRMMENVHNEMYGLLIETYVRDAEERHRLFHALEHIPVVRKKADWALRWIASTEASFAERLVAFAVVEGVFFSGSFCAIFWLKERKLMPGLCNSNTLIARDESLHQEFAAYLYSTLLATRLTDARVHEIVADAVAHEKEFICEALPVSLVGMNAHDMGEYIEFVADRLLCQLGHPKRFHARCPFEFMITQGFDVKANFFEARETSYQKAGAHARPGEDYTFDLDAAF
jgi:ribonucleotide reductase beta subunit family protein with ferritin-like domain